jgi:cytoskeletal protein RodZ
VPVTRYGPPDDPNFRGDEPTTYLRPPIGDPWYRKPVVLVAFGALGAVLIGLIVYGLAKLITGGDEPTESTPLTPLTTTSRSAAPTTAPSTQTVTETVTPTTTAPTTTTTTEPTTTTTTTTTTEPSVSTSVSTSTVTQTITVPAPPP